MPASNRAMIKKLQMAINSRGGRLLYGTSQFYSDKQNRPITLYTIKQSIFNKSKDHYSHKELFASTSQIQVVLYLRDLWYHINGWEIPTDNEMWEDIKRKKGIVWDEDSITLLPAQKEQEEEVEFYQ